MSLWTVLKVLMIVRIIARLQETSWIVFWMTFLGMDSQFIFNLKPWSSTAQPPCGLLFNTDAAHELQVNADHVDTEGFNSEVFVTAAIPFTQTKLSTSVRWYNLVPFMRLFNYRKKEIQSAEIRAHKVCHNSREN